jgi:hypothetical protein
MSNVQTVALATGGSNLPRGRANLAPIAAHFVSTLWNSSTSPPRSPIASQLCPPNILNQGDKTRFQNDILPSLSRFRSDAETGPKARQVLTGNVPAAQFRAGLRRPRANVIFRSKICINGVGDDRSPDVRGQQSRGPSFHAGVFRFCAASARLCRKTNP